MPKPVHTPVYKYRMFVQARTDLTPEEIRQYEATKTGKRSSPVEWPWRDTGEFVYARRRANAKAFYRELRQVKPIIKIKAEYVSGRHVPGGNGGRSDDVAMRAWCGFPGMLGTLNGAADEVRHFPIDNGESGKTCCGYQFSEWHTDFGKPQCPICLAAAMERRPDMKEFL